MSEQQNPAPQTRPGKTPSRSSVSRNFNIALVMLVLLCMSVFWLISYYNLQNLLRQQADSLGPKLAQQTAVLVTDQVLTNNLISINVILTQLTRDSVIAEAAVLNIDGGIIAASQVKVAPPRSVIPFSPIFGEYTAPIALQDSIAGAVRIRLDLSYIEAGMINSLIFVSAATVLIAIVAVALSTTYFQYLLIFPLKLLAFYLQRIRRGEIDTIPESRGNNEPNQTIRQYNATAQFLAQNTFIASMAEKLQSLEDGERPPLLSAQSLNATVLCVRISNFQYLSSTRDEVTMVALMNRFYFFVEKAGSLYNGQISYCSEGEVVIGFTASLLEDEQSFYAICAAHLLLQLTDEIANSGNGAEPINLKLRASVHSGTAVSGLYSPMTGLLDNVSGKILDHARQICEECPDNGVLVSEKAYQLAGAETRVSGEEFSVVDDEHRIITYLCNEPMSGIGTLIVRQAEQLSSLAGQYFQNKVEG
ncbi:MAG: AhpA/YtjB family protein [Pseudohongiellaceae bacterium]